MSYFNDSGTSLSNILPNRELNKYIYRSGAKLSKARRHSCTDCSSYLAVERKRNNSFSHSRGSPEDGTLREGARRERRKDREREF